MKPRILLISLLAALVAGALPARAVATEGRMITVQVSGSEGGPPTASKTADIRVSIRDPATGSALTGSRPALWLAPLDGPAAENTRCEAWASRLFSTPVAPAGVMDLNGFDVVQATDDGQLALIDPQLNLASANIKAIVSLGGVPDAWAIDSDGQRLWVALGKSRTVALLTLDPFAVAARHELASAPTAIAPLGTVFWVGTADGEVLRIDQSGPPVAVGSVGQGRVLLDAAGEHGLFAVAENGKGAFVNERGLSIRFGMGSEIRAAAFAPLADTLYALDRSGQKLLMVARDDFEQSTAAMLSRQAAALIASPDGRWLALTAANRQSVTIFDTKTNRERWTIEVADPVIGTVFSDAFLYLTHQKQGGVSRIVFDPEGKSPGITTIAAGTPSDIPQQSSHLPLAARIPNAGIFLASTRDRTAYMVSEEGMAPMSSLPLRAGSPVGILLRYRGLVPGTHEGDYIVRATPKYGGAYLAVVRIDQPNLVHCARVEIAGSPDPALVAAQTAATEPPLMLKVEPIQHGDQQLRFSLTGGSSRAVTVRQAVLLANNDNWRRILTDLTLVDSRFSAPVTVDYDGPLWLYVEYIGQDGIPRTLGAAVPLQAEATL